MKALVADDDPMMLDLLKLILNQLGFEVDTANCGWDAMLHLSKQKYQLLVTDLMMPDLSGLTLLSLLRNYTFDHTPIIIVSSLEYPTTVLTGFGLGASEYFVKPIDIELFTKAVRDVTSK